VVGFYVPVGLTTMWLAALVFAPFAAAVVAMGTWRQKFLALVGSRVRDRLPLGLALGAGLLVGDRVSITSIFLAEDVILGGDLLRSDPRWALAVPLAMVLFVAWVSASAALWIPAVARARSPWPSSVAGLVAAGAVLTVAMGVVSLIRATRPALEVTELLTRQDHAAVSAIAWAATPELWRLVMDPMVLIYVAQPPVTAVVLTLWAFPLSAGLALRALPASVVPRWGALEGTHAPPIVVPRLRIRPAVRAGVVGGVGLFLLFLVVRLIARGAYPDAIRDQDEFALAFFFWSIGLAVIAQAVVAGLVAARTARAPAIHGLLAACITGVGGAIAILVQPSLASCVPAFAVRFVGSATCSFEIDPSFAVRTLQHVVSLGFAAALLAGGLAVAVRAIARQTRRPA
jgi:hypothetical protein